MIIPDPRNSSDQVRDSVPVDLSRQIHANQNSLIADYFKSRAQQLVTMTTEVRPKLYGAAKRLAHILDILTSELLD